MMTAVTLDVRCPECGYNLRGLPVDSRCPECGLGLGYALTMQLRSIDDPDGYEHCDELLEALCTSVAAETSTSAEGVRMVAAAAERPAAGETLLVAGVCTRLREDAEKFYGDDAAYVLGDAGLFTGSDVGRVIEVAVKAGLILSLQWEGNWADAGVIGRVRAGNPPQPSQNAGLAPRPIKRVEKVELLAHLSRALGLGFMAVGIVLGAFCLPGFLAADGLRALVILAGLAIYLVPGFVLWQCAGAIRDGSHRAVVTVLSVSIMMILLMALQTVGDLALGHMSYRDAMLLGMVTVRVFCCVLFGVLAFHALRALQRTEG